MLAVELSYSCHMECLRVASLSGLGFSEHSSWVLRRSIGHEHSRRQGKEDARLEPEHNQFFHILGG